MIDTRDREILRRLAEEVRELAEQPKQAALRQRWLRHNRLHSDRPMVLCQPEGAWREILPDSRLECTGPAARGHEWALRAKLYQQEKLRDDIPVQACLDIGWNVTKGDMGVAIEYAHGRDRGSYVWKPPLTSLPADLSRLRFREPSLDRQVTLLRLEEARETFGSLLDVRIRGSYSWTQGLTWTAITLVGLENFMVLMYTQPDDVHALMAWLRDEMDHYLSWFEREGLLSLNNEGDFVGSGGLGYSDQLPGPGFDGTVRLSHLWGLSESQETVGVSPEMFAEFIFPYQKPLIERFGLACYGCCEGLEGRIETVKTLSNLRRVSVAPWADQDTMARALDGRYIFSRKPNPSIVCTSFDERTIRADIRQTLMIAAGQPLEFVLKDTHTVEGDENRLIGWVRIAKEEVDRALESA